MKKITKKRNENINKRKMVLWAKLTHRQRRENMKKKTSKKEKSRNAEKLSTSYNSMGLPRYSSIQKRIARRKWKEHLTKCWMLNTWLPYEQKNTQRKEVF